MGEGGESLKNYLSGALFVAALSLPMVGHMLGDTNTGQAENRALAEPPAWHTLLADWPAYPGQVNAWLEDRVGFRTPLIRLHNHLRRQWDLDNHKRAVRGDAGWLFNDLEHALDMHQGLWPFPPREAVAWVQEALALKGMAKERGASFAVMIAPNKHTVYPEYLSQYPKLKSGPTRRDSLLSLAPGEGLLVVDPVARLIEAKSRHPVYYKTGTHWTRYGAYHAYLELIDQLAAQGLDVVPVNTARLSWSELHERRGDLPALMGEIDPKPETITQWIVTQPTATDEIALSEYDWGSFPAKTWRSGDAAGRPRLLVYGDSFFWGLAPFLRESFDEVTFIHHRHGTPPLSALKAGQYDMVLLLMVERFLNRPLDIPAPGE